MSVLRRYKCHKEVLAVKISTMEIFHDGSAKISAKTNDGKYETFDTVPGWAHRYNKDYYDPGYFIQYENGYQSWSPTDAFENGYTLIEEDYE